MTVSDEPTPPEMPPEAESPVPSRDAGAGLTLVLLCIGIGVIACCVLIPQTDANRRLVYEREKLRQDLAYIEKQVETNDAFLRKMADDPNLAERLAQRQLKTVRQGTRVLELKEAGETEMSPFHIVRVEPPPPLEEYKPVGGKFAQMCYAPRPRLYILGAGLMLMAAGLVLGHNARD